MKRTKVVPGARRKLVVRAEAIIALTPPVLAAVAGGEPTLPMSKPPNCGSFTTCTGGPT